MRTTAALALLIAAATSCALPPPTPPTAEFLVSAGDQTYWVQSGTSGLHIRGSPLILARSNGRYFEVFVSEIDRSFSRAIFSGERVFKRELATGDSSVIYDDTAIVQMSADYHRRHPRAPLLDPDDDPDDDVEITAAGETDILNVLGPYVAIEHRLSIDRANADGTDDTTRTVVDLRNARAVSLDHMLRDTTVREAAGEGGMINRRWRHDRYDVVSRYDSTRKMNALALKDRRGREWTLGLVATNYVQIFWLDKPKVDPQTRYALARAFNEATTYGEHLQQVSRKIGASGHTVHSRVARHGRRAARTLRAEVRT
jgi:hypothetical protein